MANTYAPYKQFNVWYYDFAYNDKRCRVFSRIEDALQFAQNLVNDQFPHQSRFLKLESIY